MTRESAHSKKIAATPAVRLVAVVGGSGAGKGWLVERLCRLLGSAACHLPLDDFYLDRSHLPLRRRALINYDRPHAIDWARVEQVLRDCIAGRPTTMPRYDFATYSRLDDQHGWQPRPIVFVDGLWQLRPPAVRALFDLKIYLDTPTDLRCTRRLARDVAERGYAADTVKRQWRTAVLPMHERYIEPQKKWADLVLRPPIKPATITELAGRISRLSRKDSVEPVIPRRNGNQ
ncbi:MAG: uridine kinase [Opitutus sp.]|nr:uridine kinase [Opitutus sp.]